MDQNKNNSHLATSTDEQRLYQLLRHQVLSHVADAASLADSTRFYTDHFGNTYLESGEHVSFDHNLCSIVNALNILHQGYPQIGPWTNASQRRASVLIVDDEMSVRSMIKTVLEDSVDATIHEVAGGEEALAFCNNHRPDIVLLDMVMPDVDGFSVARELRLKGIPFVAATSLSDLKSLQRVIEAGCLSFIAKPMSFSQVQGVMMAALKQVKHTRVGMGFDQCCDICTARGALSAYLAISPEEAYEVIREMARDNHGSSRDIAKEINQYVDFMAKIKNKQVARSTRKDSRRNNNKRRN
ncbi:MAG: response regulator [Gammaproteobacteria bacterium]|nr:response regulator [Gammaproteobacteria bacterium]